MDGLPQHLGNRTHTLKIEQSVSPGLCFPGSWAVGWEALSSDPPWPWLKRGSMFPSMGCGPETRAAGYRAFGWHDNLARWALPHFWPLPCFLSSLGTGHVK